MNRKLLGLYKQLQPDALKTLQVRWAQSPRLQAFVQFLAKAPGENFRTQDAVREVYADTFETEPYDVLENRFYKLRKKLTQEVEAAMAPPETLLTPEEQEHFVCRMLALHHNQEEAARRLALLAERCLAINLFELLPKVLLDLTSAHHYLNNRKAAQETLGRLEAATEWAHDLAQVQLAARQLYQAQQDQQTETALLHMGTLQRFSRKHPRFVRFELVWRGERLSMAVASPNTEPVPSALRNLAKLERLREANPEVPFLSYGPNHAAQALHRLRTHAFALAFRNGDIQSAAAQMEAAWKLANNPRSGIRLSENDHRNRVQCYMAVGRFKDALAAAEDLANFQRANHRPLGLAYMLMATTYIYAHPSIGPAQPQADFLIRRMMEHAAELEQTGDVARLEMLASTQAAFLFVAGRPAEAYRLATTQHCKAYYEKLNLGLQIEFYRYFAEKEAQGEAATAQLRDSLLQNLKIQAAGPSFNHRIAAEWMLRAFL